MARLAAILLWNAVECSVRLLFKKLLQRRMRSWAEEHGGPPDEVLETFHQFDDGGSVKTALLLQLLGSLARHFLPWATALLAGAGYTVTDGSSPLVTLALAIAFYLGAQGWSWVRKFVAAKVNG